MAGTVEGGIQAGETNKKRYGENYYKTIGKKGGLISRGGHFVDREKAREWGRIGGKKSSRKGIMSKIRLKEDISEVRLGNMMYEEL